MEALLNVLPNLSIGVVSVLGLAYVSIRYSQTQQSSQDLFIKTLDQRADKHERAMNERENRLRIVEETVRVTLAEHITQAAVALRENANVMNQNTRVLDRVVRKLDGEKDSL